jgi:hypothetical protein
MNKFINTKNLAMKKYIIVDEFDNHCFNEYEFDSVGDGWDFLYVKFPVIHNEDGSRDDQEEELDSYFVIRKDR